MFATTGGALGDRQLSVAIRALAMCWLFVAAPLPGQEPPLTLERALALARTHSPGLARAEAGERGADGAALAARAARWPTVSLDALHLRLQDPPSLALGPGGILTPIPRSGTLVRVGALQPLYTGGRVRAAVDAADWAGRGAAAARERTEVELTAAVARAHDGALLSEAMLGVAEDAVAVLEAALAVAEKLYTEGVVARLDVLRAQNRLAQAKQEARAAAESARAGREMLASWIGLDPVGAAPAAGRLEPVPLELDPASVQELIVRAREDRPDLRALAARSEEARLRADLARAGRRPSAGLYVGGAATRPEVLTGREGWSSELIAAVVVSWRPLDFGRASGEAAGALAEADAFEAEARGSADAAAAEVIGQARNLERAALDIAAGRENVARAERALRIAWERYEEGVGIQLEVFEAEADASWSRAALLRAIHDQRGAVTSLYRATGTPVTAALLAPEEGR